jgi:hypothetical protein
LNASSNETAWLSCLLLGVVFGVSGALKLRHTSRFRDSLASMELVPRSWTYPLVWCLILVELLLALNLLTATASRATGIAVLGLLGVFIVFLSWHRLRGNREIACGCFADFDRKSQTMHLVFRNVLLVALAAPLLWVERVTVPDWRLSDWVLAICTLVGLYVAWTGMLQVADVIALRRLEVAAETKSS